MTPREAELTAQLEAALSALAMAQQEITLLRQKVDLLVKRVFGSSSERIDPKQLELLLQLPEQVQVAELKRSTSPTPSRSATDRTVRLPQNLPVVEEVLDPEPVQAEPEQWRCIGQEVSEQLDYEPGRFLRRRTVRRKFVRKGDPCSVPLIAPLPACLQERGLAAPGLLAQVVVSKYCDHLPLYRQEQIYARRHQVHLPRQTLARWMGLVADWLKPIYEQIRTGVLAGGYVQVDETPVEYLVPGNGQTAQGYLWTASRPRGDVVFHWATSRAAVCLARIIPADFTGTLQCDGYAAYGAFARQHPQPLTQAGCWAHVRRQFHEAIEGAPKVAGWIIRQLQHLYRIEAELREAKAGPQLRRAVRAQKSRPIVERLKRAWLALKPRYLPQSSLGQAIDYALGQWTGLLVYLDDGKVEIDNNLVENAIRPTAIGKKNWLFFGDAAAGERSAILYTIIESCRRRGLDPYTYLRDVLTRLPKMTNRQIPDVTPEAWAKSSRSPSLLAA